MNQSQTFWSMIPYYISVYGTCVAIHSVLNWNDTCKQHVVPGIIFALSGFVLGLVFK